MKFLISGNRELISPDFFRVNLVSNISMAVQICLSDRDRYWRIVSYSPFTIDVYRFFVMDWEDENWHNWRASEEMQEDERTKCRIRFSPETDEEIWFVSLNAKGIPNASEGLYWRQEKDEITFLFLAWSLLSRKSSTRVSLEYEDAVPFGFA